MKVLYLCGDPGIPLDGSKGASTHMRQTIGALASQGVEVLVAALQQGAPDGLMAEILPHDSSVAGVRMNAGIAREISTLSRCCRMAEEVHVHCSGVDLIYERYSLWSPAGMSLAAQLGVPFILEVNAPLVREQAEYRSLKLGGMARAMERAVFRTADRVLCVSQPLVEYVSEIRGGNEAVEWFPNSVDIDLFKPREVSNDAATELRVIFVGSLKPWHGVDILLESFASVISGGTPARLTLVGKGPEQERLETIASNLGIRNQVVFTGAVDQGDVPGMLRCSDLAVAPYPPMDDFYFSPLKLSEYMASGVAVIASDHPGIRAIVEHEDSALLVPPGDADALSRAMKRVLSNHRLRQELGASGRRRAEESFSLEAATTRLMTILQQEIDRAGVMALSGGGK